MGNCPGPRAEVALQADPRPVQVQADVPLLSHTLAEGAARHIPRAARLLAL